MTTDVQVALRLSTIILHVPDIAALDRCRDWYLKLGLPLSSELPGESYWFDTGPTLLGIHTGDEVSGNVTIYLDVPDADAAYESLRTALDFESAPETKPAWGGRVAYLRDPVGNRVGLVSPASAPQ
ncbi:MAG: hypothetical protein GEU75_05020 [Dehalococcoidia bacterium]|nr:hypothetical protein [Dehalococcoidia bacterium]